MLINKGKPKISLKMLFFSVSYLVVCCFIFFFIVSIIIDLLFDGEVIFIKKATLDILVVSAIAGTAGGVGSWVFAKIDEYKARKKPPTDLK